MLPQREGFPGSELPTSLPHCYPTLFDKLLCWLKFFVVSLDALLSILSREVRNL